MSVKLKFFYVFQTGRIMTVVMNVKSECLFSDISISTHLERTLAWAYGKKNRYLNVPIIFNFVNVSPI